MSLLGQNSWLEGPRASALNRLGVGVLRVLTRFPTALLAAFQDENTRVTEKAADYEDTDPSERLPDPPHLDYGEVKYGEGMHDYF